MFKYQITMSDKTALPVTSIPYVLNSLIDSQYNNIKFQKLFIDSSAST